MDNEELNNEVNNETYELVPVEPVKTQEETTTEVKEKDNTPTILCIVSLCLMFVAPGILSFLETLFSSPTISHFFYSVESICFFAAFVLMIIVRVKYRDSVFGKVLMWLYIAFIILAIIGFILLILACAALVQACGSLG